MSLESLKVLEAKIGEFVERHEQVRNEREQLRSELRDRDKKLAEAVAQLKRYEKERSEIRSRLERMLGRLAGLELT
jgi:septal ring factor EnvC (AmiA/AmiB activator)